MSKKKTAEWTDQILAGSDLPVDEFTWSEGSNYGLDGFHHDQTLGEGLNHGDTSGMAGPITPPQSTGMSDLPEGIMAESASDGLDLSFVDADGDLDLSAMLSEGGIPLTAQERHAVSLVDLSWLDPDQKQDPARLPKALRPDKPPLKSIVELEKAWGGHRRANGLSLVPNRDLEVAKYEQSTQGEPPALSGSRYVLGEVERKTFHIQKATRMSHYGRSIDEIAAYLYNNIPKTAAKKALEVIAADHGAAGHVFVRASAFPGLKNGKWVEQIRKSCRTARYVITNDPMVATKLGMEMVNQVPWKKALRQYQPNMVAGGYKVASVEEDPKKTLQLAFLTGPQETTPEAALKPVHIVPADRVTLSQAKEAFAKAPKQAREVLLRDDTAKARKAVLVLVKKAADTKLISPLDAIRFAQSKASPGEIRKAVESLARTNLAAKMASYDGVGTRVKEHRVEGRGPAWTAMKQAELDAAAMHKAQLFVAKMAVVGQLTDKEARKALAESTPEMVLKVATAYAQAAGTRKVKIASAEPAKEYAGPKFSAAPAQRVATKEISADEQAMYKAAAESGIRVSEFKALARWLRRKMSEGMAGSDLTALLDARFASPLRTAAADMVAKLRAEHEGLSGHLYVDADAYASKTGSDGCEKNASLHRANQIPYVRAMDRCKGCTLANAEGVCTKYGKELLYQLPKNAGQFQEQMIRAADASDAENTAALFNSQEYGLDDSLNIDVDEPAITEDIGSVLFNNGQWI